MTKPAAVCSSLRCGHVLAEPADRCPACGRPTWSARRVAVLGCLMLGLGLLLAAGMAVLVWLLAPGLLNPGMADAGGMRFTGTAPQGRQVLWLLVLVGLFGVLSMVNGTWQLASGRRSRPMLVATLVLVAAIVFTAWRTVAMLKA